MTVTTMEIMGSSGGKFPILPLDVEWDTGLALYCERRWPVGRRKAIEREWGLSVDDAKSVVEGKASKRILSKIWKHERGGWFVSIPIMGAVIGKPLYAFFREQNEAAAREAMREQENERLARAAIRRLASDPDRPADRGDPSAPTGEARRSFGAMGSETTRRLGGEG